MVLTKLIKNQKPLFASYLLPCKMPHVYHIHVKRFFKISKKFNFRKLRTEVNSHFLVTLIQNDKNYRYTFLALCVSIIIITLGSSIRKYFLNGIIMFLIIKVFRVHSHWNLEETKIERKKVAQCKRHSFKLISKN